jgi:hypothetical protein
MVFGGKKKKEQEEFGKSMALAGEVGEAQAQAQGSANYVNALGPFYYLNKDEQLAALMWINTQLRNMIPAFTILNEISNIDKDEADIWRWKFKIMLLKQKGYMNAKKLAEGGSILIDSLEIRSRSIVSNALNGWKGKLSTESTRVSRHVFEKPKGRFG